jgi:hypothetical protein
MLGYQTETFQSGGDQVNVLKTFQSRNSLSVSNLLDAACLALIDQQLVQREAVLATLSGTDNYDWRAEPTPLYI